MKLPYSAMLEKVLKQAAKISKKLNQNFVGSEHLLLALVSTEDTAPYQVLTLNGVNVTDIVDILKNQLDPGGIITADRDKYTNSAKEILATMEAEAVRLGSAEVGSEHLLLAILKQQGCTAVRILNTMKANLPKIYFETLMASGMDGVTAKRELSSYKKMKSGKKEGSATPTLDRYSKDVTAAAKRGELDPVVGRTKEIERVMQILSRRTKNNPCLVGEPGVGKTAVAEGVATLIAAGDVPETLRGKRLVNLDMTGMVAGTKYRGEFEERIKRVIDEVTADKNIILFVDELHTLIGAGGAEGSMDASNILKPALSRGELQMIGATTKVEYRKYIEKDAALERRFQPVDVEEPTEDETVEILKGLREVYEEHHGVTITEDAISAAAKLSTRYISDRFLPDKAIDVIDEACARKRLGLGKNDTKRKDLELELKALDTDLETQLINEDIEGAAVTSKERAQVAKKLEKLDKAKAKKQLAINENDVAEVVSTWTKIPVSKLTEKESKKLLRLEKQLEKRVIGQNEAVAAVAKAIKRSRVGLKDPKRPVGSFLFLGPTGVGKTELSKVLADEVFGSVDNMIRIDMSEYMESYSVSKIIGSAPGYVGYDEGGQLAEKVRSNPYSVVLFDEIEKAHPDVFNVLLQVLDDGHITDSHGRKIDFKNTIIIMTSNVGAQRIVDPKKLGFGATADADKDHEDMKNGVMEEVKKQFRPEFINRIDDIIVFRALSEDDVRDIANLQLKELAARVDAQMGIKLSFNTAVKKLVFDKGYDKKYGARPLRRAVQTYVEDALSEAVLQGKVEPGQSVNVTAKDDHVEFSVK